MFNRSYFNRQKFNLPAIGVEEDPIFLYEECNAHAEFGSVIGASNSLSEKCDVKEYIKGQFTLKATVVVRCNAEENFKANIHSGKTMFPADNGKNNFTAKLHAGKIMFPAGETSVNVNSRVHVGKIMLAECDADVYIMFDGEATHTQKDYITITVTIPPGEELRINSDPDNGFTAFLHNGNAYTSVIDKYEGEWINIDRNSMHLTFTGGAGTWAGELIYDERFI